MSAPAIGGAAPAVAPNVEAGRYISKWTTTFTPAQPPRRPGARLERLPWPGRLRTALRAGQDPVVGAEPAEPVQTGPTPDGTAGTVVPTSGDTERASALRGHNLQRPRDPQVPPAAAGGDPVLAGLAGARDPHPLRVAPVGAHRREDRRHARELVAAREGLRQQDHLVAGGATAGRAEYPHAAPGAHRVRAHVHRRPDAEAKPPPEVA